MKYFIKISILFFCFTTILEAQENLPDSTSPTDIDAIAYIRVGLGYNLITLKDELISPDVYSGGGLSLPMAMKGEWKYFRGGSHLNMHLGWLSPTLTESTYTFADAPGFAEGLKYGKRHFHINFLIYVQRRIKESRHLLGGSTQVFANYVNSLKQIESSHLQPFFEDARTRDKGFSMDISYTYATQLFKRPLNINVNLPIVHLQKASASKTWTFDSPNSIFRPNLNVDFVIKSYKDKYSGFRTWRLFYDWKMTYNDRNSGTYYQQFSGINTLGILLDFGDDIY